MTGIVTALARIPGRWGFALSRDADHVARLTTRAGPVAVEVVDLRNGRPGPLLHDSRLALSPATQLTCWSARALTLASPLDGGWRVCRAARAGGAWIVDVVFESDADALRLVPPPRGGDWQPIVTLAEGGSTVWRVPRDDGPARRLMSLPHPTRGGVWLDAGHTLGLDLEVNGARPSGYAIDMLDGDTERLFHVSDGSDDSIAAYHHESRLLAVTTSAFGGRHVGIADLGGDRTVRFLPRPPAGEEYVCALAFAADGRRLLLVNQDGVRSRLWAADLPASGLRPVEVPLGMIAPPLGVAADRIVVPFTSPTVPALCAGYDPVGDRFVPLEAPDLAGLDERELVTPHAVTLPGPAGPLQALRYPGRRAGDGAATAVIALHGGPVAHWSAAFDPTMQLLASLASTVLAVNYRGSTGYGADFVRAIEGRAGAADLDDVLAVAAALRPHHPTVAFYGESYGAHLALLAAARRPDLCDAVVAVAPFVSLAALRDAGTPRVARLAELLAGPDPDWRRSDLTEHGRRLRCPILLVHGARDRIIPVDQSRAIERALRGWGYSEDDVRLVELPEEDHVPVTAAARERLLSEITEFMTTPGRRTQRPLAGGGLWSAGSGTRPHRVAAGAALQTEGR